MWIKCDNTRRFVALALLEPDRITAANRAALHDGSVNTDVDLVVLGRRAQDSRILGEIPLGQGRHHTAGAVTCDAQANLISDDERVADPGIFNEGLLTGSRLHHEVWTKPPHLEAPCRIEFTEPVERGRRQQMDVAQSKNVPSGRAKSVTVSR